MARLIIRDLDETVMAGLLDRAVRHGRSIEEEVRVILCRAVRKEAAGGLGIRLVACFAGVGLDRDIEELRGHEARPATFE